MQQAVSLLRGWNYHIAADSPAALIFNVFFTTGARPCAANASAPIKPRSRPASPSASVRACSRDDEVGWFQRDRLQAIRDTFRASLDELTTKLGNDMAGWTWGRLHTLRSPTFCRSAATSAQLLDLNGKPCGGDNVTVCSGTADGNYASALGAGYRMVAEMADPNAGLWAIEVAGASGHPGSPHYADQIDAWGAGELHYIALKGDVGGVLMTLEPSK